jgi:hypothetical protein
MEESVQRLYGGGGGEGEEDDLDASLSGLSSIIQKNNQLAKDIFKKIVSAQECVEHMYTTMTQKEMLFIRDNIDPSPTPFDPDRSYHLGHMCSVLSKYINNINLMKKTKISYKKGITDMINKMYMQIEHIVNEGQVGYKPIGDGMYQIQLDDITELKRSISDEYSPESCKGIRYIYDTMKRYHSIITDKLDTYTTLIKTKTIDSPDFTKVLYQIRVYRILYIKLLLFVKHYKHVRKELMITCGEDEKNKRYLLQCLTNMETVLRIESPGS